MCEAVTVLTNDEQMILLQFQYVTGLHGYVLSPGNTQMLTLKSDLDESTRLLPPTQLLCYQTNFQPCK